METPVKTKQISGIVGLMGKVEIAQTNERQGQRAHPGGGRHCSNPRKEWFQAQVLGRSKCLKRPNGERSKWLKPLKGRAKELISGEVGVAKPQERKDFKLIFVFLMWKA